jgi:hypothetical protein
MNNTVQPWDDRDMRWAVNFAVDKDEIVRIAYEGSTTKARIFFPPYLSKGKFEAAADFFACGSVSEPWYSMNLFHERNVAPVGTDSAGNSVRWKNSFYSKNVDAMEGLPLGDPSIDAPFIAAAREWLRDLPFFPAAHAKKLYSFNTRYWVGWPSIDDPYVLPHVRQGPSMSAGVQRRRRDADFVAARLVAGRGARAGAGVGATPASSSSSSTK